ncbi:DUF6760 family protein [Geobacter sp.]|uniref:DUF6760 family protein n=1 Tax=Geobacter sp. TaxID=46610 RepID=UPI00345AE698
MPPLQQRVRGGARTDGGVIGYPLAQLYEEVASLAHSFHWSHDQLMELEHADRRRWVEEIAKMGRARRT